VTSAYVATRPKAFDMAFSTLMSIAGSAALDRIIWGTGAVAFHPQPLLESFVRDFQFSEATRERTAVMPLTKADKEKILFRNYAAMTGVDLDRRLAACSEDEFSRSRSAGRAAPFSTLSFGHA